MAYELTVWKLTGKADEVDSVFIASTDTHFQAIELFDCAIRGISGHYKAWLRDTVKDVILRESYVTWK